MGNLLHCVHLLYSGGETPTGQVTSQVSRPLIQVSDEILYCFQNVRSPTSIHTLSTAIPVSYYNTVAHFFFFELSVMCLTDSRPLFLVEIVYV